MCDTPDRARLVIPLGFQDGEALGLGKWYYFSLRVSATGSAEMTIWDSLGALKTATQENFFVTQAYRRDYMICFGFCDSALTGVERGFHGGLREVTVANEY